MDCRECERQLKTAMEELRPGRETLQAGSPLADHITSCSRRKNRLGALRILTGPQRPVVPSDLGERT
jgi:hypothetical protein